MVSPLLGRYLIPVSERLRDVNDQLRHVVGVLERDES